MIAASFLLAAVVVPEPWGLTLVVSVVAWEVAEKLYWIRFTRRIPVAVGREAMIGLPVTVVSACRPEGRVQLLGERWTARCTTGASVDRLIIEAVERLTLVVARPDSDSP